MSNEFENMMGELGQEFDNQEASEFGFDVPDGDYIVLVKSGSINQAKTSGRWQVSWDFVILADVAMKYRNRHIFTHWGITKVDKATKKHEIAATSVSIMKSGFRKIGIQGVTSQNLAPAVEAATGKVVAVTVKTSGDYTNCNFIGPVADNINGFSPPTSSTQFAQWMQAVKTNAQKNPSGQPQQAQRSVASPTPVTAPAANLQFEE